VHSIGGDTPDEDRKAADVRKLNRILAATTALALATAGVVAAPPAQAADSLVIWSDPAHAPVLEQLLAKGYQGTPVTVIAKDPATVRNELSTVRPADAPDVVWGDLAWTGELASAELIVPVPMTKKRRALFRGNVLAGSNVGGERYGVPVQISNLALVTNTALVPQQPTTFKALSDLALKLKKEKKVKVPFAVAQSEGTSPWSTYPMFSGLGGYLFGKASNGSLNVQDVGLANKKFLGNSGQINTWNADLLIKSSLTLERARTVFKKGKSPFFLAGPEDLGYLLDLGFAYRIGSLPPMVSGIKPVPLLTVHGLMVTRFAAKHDLEQQALALVGKKLSRIKPQQSLAGAQGWYPANTKAAATVPTGGGRIRAIGNAGVDGVPMPNVPEAATLWAPYATAWSTSTSGKSATPAKKAFKTAQREVNRGLTGGTVPTPAE
jgi:arabinogalactan oligomer/maltooligosaccharide transport system substrate-binding protein